MGNGRKSSDSVPSHSAKASDAPMTASERADDLKRLQDAMKPTKIARKRKPKPATKRERKPAVDGKNPVGRAAPPRMTAEESLEKLRQLRQMIVLGLPESDVRKKLGIGQTLQMSDYEAIRRELAQEKRAVTRFELYVECDERLEHLWRASLELIQMAKGKKALGPGGRPLLDANGMEKWDIPPDVRALSLGIKTAREIQESKVHLSFRLGAVARFIKNFHR